MLKRKVNVEIIWMIQMEGMRSPHNNQLLPPSYSYIYTQLLNLYFMQPHYCSIYRILNNSNKQKVCIQCFIRSVSSSKNYRHCRRLKPFRDFRFFFHFSCSIAVNMAPVNSALFAWRHSVECTTHQYSIRNPMFYTIQYNTK